MNNIPFVHHDSLLMNNVAISDPFLVLHQILPQIKISVVTPITLFSTFEASDGTQSTASAVQYKVNVYIFDERTNTFVHYTNQDFDDGQGFRGSQSYRGGRGVCMGRGGWHNRNNWAYRNPWFNRAQRSPNTSSSDSERVIVEDIVQGQSSPVHLQNEENVNNMVNVDVEARVNVEDAANMVNPDDLDNYKTEQEIDDIVTSDSDVIVISSDDEELVTVDIVTNGQNQLSSENSLNSSIDCENRVLTVDEQNDNVEENFNRRSIVHVADQRESDNSGYVVLSSDEEETETETENGSVPELPSDYIHAEPRPMEIPIAIDSNRNRPFAEYDADDEQEGDGETEKSSDKFAESGVHEPEFEYEDSYASVDREDREVEQIMQSADRPVNETVRLSNSLMNNFDSESEPETDSEPMSMWSPASPIQFAQFPTDSPLSPTDSPLSPTNSAGSTTPMRASRPRPIPIHQLPTRINFANTRPVKDEPDDSDDLQILMIVNNNSEQRDRISAAAAAVSINGCAIQRKRTYLSAFAQSAQIPTNRYFCLTCQIELQGIYYGCHCGYSFCPGHSSQCPKNCFTTLRHVNGHLINKILPRPNRN